MQFKHVALAGSVLPTDFDWRKLKRQVEHVRNDRASRDWPVALLCSALRGWGMREVGTAGFAGFNGGDTTELAYYQGHHGAALKPEYHDRLVEFIFGGNPVAPHTLISSPGYYRQLSNAMPYLAVLLATLIIVPMVWFCAHGWWNPLLWSALGAVLIYVVLDVA
jgi:hypothetical protein